MSNRLIAYRVPPQMEFKAARELREHGHRAYVPRDLADKRRPPVARGYVFSGGKHAFARHVRGAVGAVTTAELGRLYAVRKPTKASANPYTIGQHVTVGEVPGVVASTNGDSCVVAVTMIGKQHLLKPLHYERLRPG